MEDEDGKRYQELVAQIESVEASSSKPDEVALDVWSATGAPLPEQPKSYAELVDIINGIESGGRRMMKEPQEKRIEQPSLHLVTSGVAQASYTYGIPRPQPPSGSPAEARTGMQVPSGERMKQHKERIKKEMVAITNRLSSLKPKLKLELKKRNIRRSDLVLPSLSLADQISEVERIIEGIRENVFDKEHMDIVSQEIYGLQDIVKEEKASINEQAEQGSLEQSLRNLRDQRLSEAIRLMQQGGAA
jgi:hypothetical protein